MSRKNEIDAAKCLILNLIVIIVVLFYEIGLVKLQ